MHYFNQESKRLKFRPLTEADIPFWTPFFINNDRLKYLGIDLTKASKTLATNWIHKQLDRYKTNGLGHLAVIIKETNEFIGVGGIIPRTLNEVQEYEIAYSLIPQFWKKGFGTEVATHMKNYGIQHIKINRFISIIHKENKDSIRVAEKNEMTMLFETTFMGMDVFVYGIEWNLKG